MVFKELVLGRIFVGLGVGLASAVIPLYLAELSPAKYRGRIVASLVVLITGGEHHASQYRSPVIYSDEHRSGARLFR